MNKKVSATCSDCGVATVHKFSPEQTSEFSLNELGKVAHKQSMEHKLGADSKKLLNKGLTGRLSGFAHGKDHN